MAWSRGQKSGGRLSNHIEYMSGRFLGFSRKHPTQTSGISSVAVLEALMEMEEDMGHLPAILPEG